MHTVFISLQQLRAFWQQCRVFQHHLLMSFNSNQLVDVDQVGQPVHRLLVHELDVLFRELRLWRLGWLWWLLNQLTSTAGRRLGALLEDQLPCCATLSGSVPR